MTLHVPASAPAGAPASLHPFDRYGKGARAFLIVVVTTVVGLALAVMTNGLPAAEAAKRMAARAYLPLLTSGYPTTGRERITVLTMDDQDLAYLGLNWPVPMDYYQRLLDRLVAAKPKALFIDILFLDDRPAELVARFAQAACAARDAGIPVYIASLQEQKRPSRTMTQLAAARTASGAPCLQSVAPNLLDDHYDRSTWDYPLGVAVPGAPAPIRSAAAALACDVVPSACPAMSGAPMALLWPTHGDPLNPIMHLSLDADGVMQRSCVNEVAWVDLVPLLPYTVRNIVRGGPKPTLCPYNRQIPIRALSGVGLNAAERDAVVRDKILLLGTAFQSNGDRVVSPLGQDLVGVHAHAMALDNLITLKGQYRRSGDFDPLEPASPASLFTMSAVLLLVLGSILWHRFEWGTKPGIEAPVNSGAPVHGGTPLAPTARWFDPEPYLRRPGLHAAPPMVRYRTFLMRALVLLPLRALTAWQWPQRRKIGGAAWWQRLLRAGAAIVLFLLGMWLIFWLGDRVFRVGPLAVIDYFLFPLGVDFLDRGNRMARHVALWIHACKHPEPVAELRHWLHAAPDEH